VGVVGSRGAVIFDEIANTDFSDPKALVSIRQGYMQDGKFSRGKKEILAFASIVLVGNIDIQAKLPHEKYYHFFEPLPDFLQVEAFIDRLHGYVPGWEIPKSHPGSLAQDYGFITDYFCAIVTGIVSALTGRPVRNDIHDRRDHHHGQGPGHRRRPAQDAGCHRCRMKGGDRAQG
jgi:predicted ATP-dependent Lon-type protease